MASYSDISNGLLKDDDGDVVLCEKCDRPFGTNVECHNCLYGLYAHLERNRVLDDNVDPDRLHKAFEELHHKGAEEFGTYWLKVNRMLVNEIGDDVRYTEQPAKYILTKIAYVFCKMIKEDEERIRKEIADRLEGKPKEC